MKKLFLLVSLLIAMFSFCGMRPAYAQTYTRIYTFPDDNSEQIAGVTTFAGNSEVDQLKLEITALKEEIAQMQEAQTASALMQEKIIEALVDRIEKLEANPFYKVKGREWKESDFDVMGVLPIGDPCPQDCGATTSGSGDILYGTMPYMPTLPLFGSTSAIGNIVYPVVTPKTGQLTVVGDPGAWWQPAWQEVPVDKTKKVELPLPEEAK